MAERRRWFDRQFEPGVPEDSFPGIVARVRGTPGRLADLVRPLSSEVLVRSLDESWSIQENVGHLLDLEPLWLGRLEDLLAGAERLRPADLQNRKTHEAEHNTTNIDTLLAQFRDIRMGTVGRLEQTSGEALRHTSLHPRLEQAMTVVDLFYFVAEHDDHHLARIGDIISAQGSRA